ncbi:hypothetical protein FEI13_18395 [Halomonas urmiana]|uniref:Uncharacterized protein n=1 Tax=Halomonas urmiana TaxID=490901 RepID=A0A5R8M6C4_9GAMM|nr:hypothetical protein [Halomonas urmiana]TLF45107.1 hypothetical protein FEI13_18395 [Halomonas urmiana]
MSVTFYLHRNLSAGDKIFSETALLAASRLIVVLAEPGAGKTRLLESLAQQQGTSAVTANRFAHTATRKINLHCSLMHMMSWPRMYLAVRTFGPSWKVVKKVVSSGIVGPSTYRLATETVDAPDFSDEKIREIISSIGPELGVAQLDQLSDSIRQNYGSEKLQQEVPTLSPPERGVPPDPAKDIRRMLGW